MSNLQAINEQEVSGKNTGEMLSNVDEYEKLTTKISYSVHIRCSGQEIL